MKDFSKLEAALFARNAAINFFRGEDNSELTDAEKDIINLLDREIMLAAKFYAEEDIE